MKEKIKDSFENRIGCELWIYTKEKDPKIITKNTGVSYTVIREIGKPWLNIRTGKTNERNICKENIWILVHEIVFGDHEDVYLNQAILGLLEVISSKQDLFKEFFFNTEYISLIRCYGYYYDYHMYFRIDTALIRKLNELNLILDFDLYSFSKKMESEIGSK